VREVEVMDLEVEVEVVAPPLAVVKEDPAWKLYEVGDGSSVYLLETPKSVLETLLPYASPSAVNG
jgi:hypothetical protein